MTPEALFAARLAADPGRPLVTFYDERTGERAELSAASMANWVTKTYFLLTDEVGVNVGDLAAVRLPMHYLRLVVLVGAWFAGMTLATAAGPDVRAAFAHREADLHDLRQSDEVFALALRPWGQGYPADPPDGSTDFVAAVRPQPDKFAQVRPVADADVAATPGVTRAQLGELAASRAAELGLAPGGRLLLRDDGTATDDLPTWLAPLAVEGSLILVAGADDATIERLSSVERVTTIA
ncbi:MAG TPA: TIGR03089 family protein [Jatrophihabitantaceae bacterium]|jgi:uncharacterized protein (TIGR03089 family)|nr:TIGR03089 family protein [Jatrophihabitantaceae bacterium]